MSVYFLGPMFVLLFSVPWILRLKWPHKISWIEMSVSIIASIVITSIVYFTGMYTQMDDVEILNGQVLSKNREHGTWLESYSCRCHTSCSGSGKSRSCSSHCSTCYRKHYTVSWDCDTSVGSFNIDHEDSTSSLVYALPDPNRYTTIQKGDPVAKTHHYDNYIKAVPDSLFHQVDLKQFEQKIPPYPDNIYDIYNINRAVSVGVPVPDINDWNRDISMMLRTLGPSKQVNVAVVFTDVADQSYLYALEGKWLGGKKNDVIVVFGTSQYPKIDWIGVLSWTDNQLFKVELRDELYAMGNVDRARTFKIIEDKIQTRFVRKEMADFEYLKSRIEPPTWAIVLAFVLGLLMMGGTSIWFYRENPFD